jgi:hypothetical protein
LDLLTSSGNPPSLGVAVCAGRLAATPMADPRRWRVNRLKRSEHDLDFKIPGG